MFFSFFFHAASLPVLIWSYCLLHFLHEALCIVLLKSLINESAFASREQEATTAVVYTCCIRSEWEEMLECFK